MSPVLYDCRCLTCGSRAAHLDTMGVQRSKSKSVMRRRVGCLPLIRTLLACQQISDLGTCPLEWQRGRCRAKVGSLHQVCGCGEIYGRIPTVYLHRPVKIKVPYRLQRLDLVSPRSTVNNLTRSSFIDKNTSTLGLQSQLVWACGLLILSEVCSAYCGPPAFPPYVSRQSHFR